MYAVLLRAAGLRKATVTPLLQFILKTKKTFLLKDQLKNSVHSSVWCNTLSIYLVKLAVSVRKIVSNILSLEKAPKKENLFLTKWIFFIYNLISKLSSDISSL